MADIPVPNGGFEEGTFNHWSATPPIEGNPDFYIQSSGEGGPFEGSYFAANRTEGEITLIHDDFFDCVPGDTVNVSCYLKPTRGSDRGTVRIYWFDAAGAPISPSFTENPHRTPGHIEGTGGWRRSFLNNIPVPANARRFKIGAYIRSYTRSIFGIDAFRVDVTPNRSVTLIAPADGSEWMEGDTIQFQADVGGNAPPVTRVEYLVDGVVVGSATAAPYRYNFLNVQEGVYEVQARLVLQGGIELLSEVHTFTVLPDDTPPPPPPTTPREYNASNAYTNLVLENFSGLSSQIPGTALVTGAEVEIDFKLDVLSRTKDIGIEDPANANDLAPFDIVDQVETHVTILGTDGGYSAQGSPEVATTPIVHTNFSIVETGVTEGKKWSVRRNDSLYTVVVGEEDFLWGLDPIAFPEFATKALGIKFVPRVGAVPSYADAGDAAFRFYIDRVRIRVYFDAGSVEYYFASPDGENVIKGTLVAYCVAGGEWSSGDAYGELQLSPDFEIMDGNASAIGDEWAIHSAYPPNDANRIGKVEADEEGWGMRYNGLPTQQDIIENGSRYEFITTNFYGDKEMNSFYGVHGLPRAFAYNPNFFYKICTQPDAGKDRPRHIANHHGHLALGYDDGRVDLSVVGEPYNFDGALGASSWATADPVTGLLPLPGMILGIFGEKSVTGLSGTTVDNFATQTISPKMGAIEYTIADMGFPVYANHYGIYTLSQVQQYGDYMGTPLSQDISPWLRPRLVRSGIREEEVVCAWPVRSKNQYRLAFGDGAILTMTINNGQQGAPTFSKQKYFKVPELEEGVGCEVSYDMEAIVPIAISSELSHTGEERIHMAPYIEPPPPPPEPVELIPLYISIGEGMSALSVNWPEGYDNGSTIEVYKDGNIVGVLNNFNYNDSTTLESDPVWYSNFYEEIGQGDIVTLKQGDWEAEMYIEENTPAVISFRPSQVYPMTSYWESELRTYGNNWIDSSAVLRIRGSEYTVSHQLLDGTYAWVYDQDFPTEITEWTEAEVSIDGEEFVPAYVIAAAWYPVVNINTSRWDGSEYRTAAEMFDQKWGGFDAQEDTYFTLTRDGVVYTFTKGAYSRFWCDVDMDTVPPVDENNPWLMEYEAGSYLVTMGPW